MAYELERAAKKIIENKGIFAVHEELFSAVSRFENALCGENEYIQNFAAELFVLLLQIYEIDESFKAAVKEVIDVDVKDLCIDLED